MKSYKAEIIGQKIWIKNNNQTWSYDLLDVASETARRKKSQTATPEKILSLMPGKITKVFVKEGDQVVPGQALVVMEAMKMEYTLKSDISGIVEKLNAALNDQVSLGQLLILLKKASGNE